MEPCGTLRNLRFEEHPCYSREAHRKFARMHLPVAPRCNILCHYCRREYDCVNESRPGVTSEVLSPRDALKLVDIALRKVENLAVVGIAGPGDPLANPEETFATFHMLKDRHPALKRCLSTNGLAILECLDDIRACDVSHITVTMNALDPEIGEQIYDFILADDGPVRGLQASDILIGKQTEGIRQLRKLNVLIKVNTLIIPGINDRHIPELSKYIKGLGVDLHNIVPLIPVRGTRFENVVPPTNEQRMELQRICEPNLPQMRHCRQCRADAVGRLGEPGRISELLKEEKNREDGAVRIAVATTDGKHVDAHFGHVKAFHIYDWHQGAARLVEIRDISKAYCSGPSECSSVEDSLERIHRALGDCQLVLCRRIGYAPSKFLTDKGMRVEESFGNIGEDIQSVFSR